MNNNNIISWNCNGIYSHFEELKLLISNYNPAVILLQETHLRHNQQFTLKSYNIIQSSTEPMNYARGGVLIAIRSDINYETIDLNTHLEFVAAKIYLKSHITVGSVYLPPSLNIHFQEIYQVFQLLPPSFLVAGDFNAHSPSWGSDSYNSKGNVIEELIGSLDLTLLNTNDPTFYSFAHKKWSTLDLVLTTPELSTFFSVFNHEDLADSDHVPLIINFKHTNPSNTIAIRRWNYNRTNWNQFHSICNDYCITTPSDVNRDIQDFTTFIVNCARTCSPKASNGRRQKQVPWWTADCAKAIKNRRKALKKLKRFPTLDNHVLYSKARANARRTIKRAKVTSWRNYASTITPATPIQTVWRKVKSLEQGTRFHIPTSVKINNHIISDIDNILKLFADHFMSSSSNVSLSPDFLIIKSSKSHDELNFSSENAEPYNQLLTMEELNYAIMNMRPGATGPDGFHLLMLRNSPPQILTLVLQMFNNIWTTGNFPESWKTVFIVPLLKPNKNSLILDSYRPISLSSVFGKLFEKIINNRLMWVLETNDLLSNRQFGFRPSRSTIDATFSLSNAIHEAISQRQHLLAVFFDCTKAFDLTWRFKIMEKLHAWNFKGRLPRIINSFLQNRKFRVKLGNFISEDKILENGVPQGSVLSPTLFNIAINDIIQKIEAPVHSTLFADDLAIFVKCKNANSGETILQETVNKISTWSQQNGFRFSTDKTKAVHFCRVRNCDHHLNITLNNVNLLRDTKVRYLGLIFDQKLKWKDHINQLKHACFSKINLLKKLCSTHYGAHRASLLNIYNALIKSKCDYGSPIYSSATLSCLRTLNSLHHSAIRMAIGALRSTPTISLMCEANQLPSELRRDYLLLSYLIHYNETGNLPVSPPFTNTNYTSYTNEIFHYKSRSILEDLNLSLPPVYHKLSYPSIPPWNTSPFGTELSLTTMEKLGTKDIIKSAFLELVSKFPAYDRYYTDGSKNERTTGCSVVTEDLVLIRYSLPQVFSILSAELFALFLATRHILTQTNATTNLILSDSLSAIQILNRVHDVRQHPIAKEIISLLNENRHHHVVFVWIPGHAGIQGNELADRAAKEASTCFPLPLISVPGADIRAIIKSKILTKWRNDWSAVPLSNKLRSIKPTTQPWSIARDGNRREDTVICRLRLGHTLLTHEHLFLRLEAPLCTGCGVPISVRHILVECPAYTNCRIAARLPVNLEQILGDNPGGTKRLVKFVKLTGLYNRI